MSPITRSCMLSIAILLAGAPAQAFEASSARLSGLERSLRIIASRIARLPREAKVDLQRAGRDLHVLRLERPRDPRLGKLRQQIRDERWAADRVIRRARETKVPRLLAPPSIAYPVARVDHGPAGGDLLGSGRAGLGARLVGIQRSLASGGSALDRGDLPLAEAALSVAERDMESLEDALDHDLIDDPNLIAVRDQIRALQVRLASFGAPAGSGLTAD